jgi:ADP-ribosylglycohydrolase
VFGALLGAALGFEAIPKRWINGLSAHDELNDEIEQFVQRFE